MFFHKNKYQKAKHRSSFGPYYTSGKIRQNSTLGHVLGNFVPINAIDRLKASPKKRMQFNIDSPPDKLPLQTKPSLTSQIQQMSFTNKTPEYQACMRILEEVKEKADDVNN